MNDYDPQSEQTKQFSCSENKEKAGHEDDQNFCTFLMKMHRIVLLIFSLRSQESTGLGTIVNLQLLFFFSCFLEQLFSFQK